MTICTICISPMYKQRKPKREAFENMHQCKATWRTLLTIMDLCMISLTSGNAPSWRWFSRSQLTESQTRASSISIPSNPCAAQNTLEANAVNLTCEEHIFTKTALIFHHYRHLFFFILHTIKKELHNNRARRPPKKHQVFALFLL